MKTRKKNRKQARIKRREQRQKRREQQQLKRQQSNVKKSFKEIETPKVEIDYPKQKGKENQQADETIKQPKQANQQKQSSRRNVSRETYVGINTIDIVRSRLAEITNVNFKEYPIENRKNVLLQILDDNYTLYEQDYLYYLKENEPEISQLLGAIQYESNLEEVEFSFARLGRLLNMGVYSEEIGEQLSYMSEFM